MTRYTQFARIAALAALFSLTPALISAQSADSTKPRSLPFRGEVGSVDLTARTVTLAGKKKDRVMHVADDTRLEKDGKPATLEDIQPGDAARGSYRKNAEGQEVLVKATFGPKSDPESTGGATAAR